jgi:Zn-dependent protease
LSDTLGLSDTFVSLSFQIIVLNVFLAFFNMLPIPPLDGSKVLPVFLPFDLKMKYQTFRNHLEQNIGLAFLIVFGLVFFVFGQPLYYATVAVARLLAGL